jgi:predicted nucleic acid-binding protein
VNILDTDALSHHMKRNTIGAAIDTHMRASPNLGFRITAISAFEMVDGALALYKHLKQKRKDLIPGFSLIQETIEYLGDWQGRICAYDGMSEQIYRSFAPRLRQEIEDDARIAAIALALGAAMWTCNVDDSKRVPGLIVHRAETGLRVT